MSKITRRSFLGAAAGGAVAAALNPSALIAGGGSAMVLPPPSGGNESSLITALKQRKSTRSFDGRPVPDQHLSDLLWAAFGVNRQEKGFRTAPSPMNSQEIDIYLSREDGLSLYDPFFHQLVPVSDEDMRKACGRQPFVAAAPLNLIFVADLSRLGRAREDRRPFYAMADTGFISQNVYLFCAVSGLGTVVRDSVDRPVLAEKMQLKPDQEITLVQTVGYPK